jgi:tetratricopeptide (TPR) repeat protein
MRVAVSGNIGRWSGRLLAAALLVTLLFWIGSTVFNFRHSSQTGADSSATGRTNLGTESPRTPGNPAAVHVPIALLVDYYEHGIEHAPPRDPSGVMQKREDNYTAPPVPFALLHAKLTSSPPDSSLMQAVNEWQVGWLKGNATTKQQLDSIERLATDSSLKSIDLIDLGRAFNFLDGDPLAARWYRSGLAKAEMEYKATSPADPATKPLLDRLDQMKALWRLKDYPAMEKRFGLAMRLNSPLSPEARRAGYLYAEALYHQARSGDAAEVILAVQRDHDRAGDLGLLEKSDILEMHWIQAIMLFNAERYEEALPHLKDCAAITNEHKRGALELLVFCLVRLNYIAEARDAFKHVMEEVPDTVLVSAMAAEIQARTEVRFSQGDKKSNVRAQ